MKLFFSWVLLSLLSISIINISHAATITSNSDGVWSNGSTWVGGISPGPGDDVIIQNGHDITVSSAITCRNLRINSSSDSTILQVNSNQSLTVTSTFYTFSTGNNHTVIFDILGSLNYNFRFRVYASHPNLCFEVNGPGRLVGSQMQLRAQSSASSTIKLNCPTTTVDFSMLTTSLGARHTIQILDSLNVQNFNMTSLPTDSLFVNNANSVLTINSALTGNFRGALRAPNGSVWINASSLPWSSSWLVNDLNVIGNTSQSNDLSSVNDLTIHNSSILNSNNNNITMTGDLVVNGSLDMISGDSLILNSTAASPHTISGSGTMDFMNVTMDCPDASGGVTVNSPINIRENLILTDGTFTTNGNVTLISNANGTANLGEIGSGVIISGNLTCQKWFSGMNNVADWVYFHVPGTPQLLEVINSGTGGNNPRGFYTFGYTNSDSPATPTYKSSYRYNPGLAAAASGSAAERFEAGWVPASNGQTDQFFFNDAWVFLLGGNSGIGARDTYELSFDIQPQFPASVVGTGSGDNTQSWRGWNLFGNPYASAVQIDTVSMFHAIQGQSMIVYDRTSSYVALSQGDVLPAYQSFFVQVVNGTGSVTFDQSNKSTNTTTQIYKKITRADQIDIHLTRDSAQLPAHAYIKFNDQGGFGFDQWDLYQLRNGWPRPNVALVEQDTLALMIDNIPLSFDKVSIPIRAEAAQSDWHTLEFENLPDRSACYLLEDLETGNIVDLKTKNSYRFWMEDTTQAPRFVLHITKGVKDSEVENASCFGTEDGMAIAKLNPSSTFDVLWLDEQGDILKESFNVQGNDTLSGIGAGDYHIQVSDQNGQCAYMEEIITVFEPSEVDPDFEASTLIPNTWANEEVSFTNESSGATNFEWDFGDGSAISTEVNPSHIYENEGTYVVSLRASNGNPDCDARKLAIIKAVKNPPASMDEVTSNQLSVIQKAGLHYLQFDDPKSDEYEVSVSNLLGQSIYSGSWNTNENEVFELKIPGSGIHIVNVKSGEFNESIKLGSQNK